MYCELLHANNVEGIQHPRLGGERIFMEPAAEEAGILPEGLRKARLSAGKTGQRGPGQISRISADSGEQRAG